MAEQPAAANDVEDVNDSGPSADSAAEVNSYRII